MNPFASIREKQRAREAERARQEIEAAANAILDNSSAPLVGIQTADGPLRQQWVPTDGGRKRDHARIFALTVALQEMAMELAAERRRTWEMATAAHLENVCQKKWRLAFQTSRQETNDLHAAWAESVSRFIAYMTVAREQIDEHMPAGAPKDEVLRMFARAAQLSYPEDPRTPEQKPGWSAVLLLGAFGLLGAVSAGIMERVKGDGTSPAYASSWKEEPRR